MDEKLPLFYRIMCTHWSPTKLNLPPIISQMLVQQEIEQVLLSNQKGIWKFKSMDVEESSGSQRVGMIFSCNMAYVVTVFYCLNTLGTPVLMSVCWMPLAVREISMESQKQKIREEEERMQKGRAELEVDMDEAESLASHT